MKKKPITCTPKWKQEQPKRGSFRSIFKWGANDLYKHPSMGFCKVIKQELGLTDAVFKSSDQLGDEIVENSKKSAIAPDDIQKFKAIVGKENLFTDTYSRLKHSTGKSMEDIINLRQQKIDKICDIVLHPKNKEEVQQIVNLCHQRKIALHVYGGGSSVTQGLACPKGGVTLVMSTHMNRLISLNETNLTVTVEAGMMGPVYEDLLNHAPEKLKAARRYTGGHFPQSFEYSTVGGWVVTLGSGQASSFYGDAYDLAISQEYITPKGSFKTHDFPATATGPKINDIMKGSEGCFGVLVAVTMKIFYHHPDTVSPFSFMFPNFESATNTARQISQAGFGMPAIIRVSDAEETDIAIKMYGLEKGFLDKMMTFKGLKTGKRSLLMGQVEGERSFSKNVFNQVKKIGKRNKGLYLTGYPTKKWHKGRFSDPYIRDDLNDFNVIIDTLEAGVSWEHIHDLHQSVRAFIKQHPHIVCMTHASHFYAQGTNLYFIFITRMTDLDYFRRFQADIIEKIIQNHGSLSHHHGIGKMLAPFMEKHIGKTQMDILRALKAHFDPHNIMNPGGLGL